MSSTTVAGARRLERVSGSEIASTPRFSGVVGGSSGCEVGRGLLKSLEEMATERQRAGRGRSLLLVVQRLANGHAAPAYCVRAPASPVADLTLPEMPIRAGALALFCPRSSASSSLFVPGDIVKGDGIGNWTNRVPWFRLWALGCGWHWVRRVCFGLFTGLVTWE
jgi:hypothetical protein